MITTILIGLFLAERAILNYLYMKTRGSLLEEPIGRRPEENETDEDQDEDVKTTEWMRGWADRIRWAIDAFLLIGSGLLPLLIAYMLPSDREDPDPDWWIESSLTRSYWFWFFFTPTPQMSAYPRFGMVSNFAPIGITDIGNLGVPYITDDHHPARAVTGRWFRWLRGSWEMAFYTTVYPPDLGHVSLASTLIFLLLALLDLLPQALLTFNPLLIFGRAPIFFYSIQLLLFHYLLPSVLVILDWPRNLNLFWISVVSFSSLPVLWLACEAWVIFKDCKSPQSVEI
ncbi:hypothetical protein PGTUg99_031675 [Puccinia graminis f. sp. tritici]|uniref:Uncharacterized protein n=1 Tax=Puccinia graminis f. sp. tritici TaxID=56615 RepID=A0A5B0RL23_PUCGR|nr:hypothetical protein PGTUg99_031675 [Puccinia graminis f. sp. tritici]